MHHVQGYLIHIWRITWVYRAYSTSSDVGQRSPKIEFKRRQDAFLTHLSYKMPTQAIPACSFVRRRHVAGYQSTVSYSPRISKAKYSKTPAMLTLNEARRSKVCVGGVTGMCRKSQRSSKVCVGGVAGTKYSKIPAMLTLNEARRSKVCVGESLGCVGRVNEARRYVSGESLGRSWEASRSKSSSDGLLFGFESLSVCCVCFVKRVYGQY